MENIYFTKSILVYIEALMHMHVSVFYHVWLYQQPLLIKPAIMHRNV